MRSTLPRATRRDDLALTKSNAVQTPRFPCPSLLPPHGTALSLHRSWAPVGPLLPLQIQVHCECGEGSVGVGRTWWGAWTKNGSSGVVGQGWQRCSGDGRAWQEAVARTMCMAEEQSQGLFCSGLEGHVAMRKLEQHGRLHGAWCNPAVHSPRMPVVRRVACAPHVAPRTARLCGTCVLVEMLALSLRLAVLLLSCAPGSPTATACAARPCAHIAIAIPIDNVHKYDMRPRAAASCHV